MNVPELRSPVSPPEDDMEVARVKARVVWYYFMGGLTQQEIADRLGITRLRVNRIIGSARTDGSVRVEVSLPLAECVSLEEELKSRFGLLDAAVVPALPAHDAQQRAIGEAAGTMLGGLLEDGRSVGVGWGKTLRACIPRLPARRFSRSWVTALMGGLTRGSGANTFEVSTQLADALGADCYYLAAPIYCPTEESREALLAHPGIADVLRRARAVDAALLSCGDLSERSLLASTSTVWDMREELLGAGAVGDLLGTFIDAEGAIVDHPLNQRVVALAPDELRSIPATILASGSLYKAPVIGAILRGGYVNRVVTDEACARALLAGPAR
ncbi:sugar-binding transcriptional regulator [Salinarimonas soli]|uniref:Sugar-binding transcriptional regulator n=1 Tax=Salinarimonas soli TaxID=1638099 RepID=A0A5B2W109_9HYPH|nr:sugar-binding transcriptional regulator [Salinarimonas soli]KAA2244332.1 sugar-binding transcriptional regulator [Salinarimonas soli]